MKRILITGKGSYIGTKVEEWLGKYPDDYKVEVLDMIGDGWKELDLHGYDVVYHVAGIAHRKDATDDLYEQVNHVLAVDVAEKAADSGVKQFVFMSSGAVYSQSDRKHGSIVVDRDSPFLPETPYGYSKLRAEEDIKRIKRSMKVAILRPPTVYGPGAKGNYNRLARISKTSPIFPDINNKRSMIYIDNLCEFVRLIIDKECEGEFLPQNRDYVKTSDMVRIIARANGHKIWITPILNRWIQLLAKYFDSINKAVGTYYYERECYFEDKYIIVDFEKSIIMTEDIVKRCLCFADTKVNT